MQPVRFVTRFHVLVLLLLLAITLVSFHKIPADTMLPVHWAPRGNADWLWPRDAALLLMPGMALLITLIFSVIPRFAPPERVEPGRHVTEAALTGTLGVFCAIQFGLLLIGIGSDLDLIRIVSFGVALLMLFLGFELPRSMPNAYAGIRLPWTMHDHGSWRATHRFVGVLCALCGVGLGLCAWLQPDPATLIFALMAAIIGPALLGIAFSFALSRR
jgi:uncharacterized membrane protein